MKGKGTASSSKRGGLESGEDSIKVSLSQNLCHLVLRAAQKKDENDKNGFFNWAVILGRKAGSPELIDDLNLFHRGFLSIRRSISVNQSMPDGLRKKHLDAASRLHGSVDPTKLNRKWDQIVKENLQQADISMLENLDYMIDLTHQVNNVPREDLYNVKVYVQESIKALDESDIDDAVRAYIRTVLENVEKTLDSFEIYGVEGLWRDVAKLQSAIVRFEEVFKDGQEETLAKLKETTSKALRLLERLGSIYGGARALLDLTMVGGYLPLG